tara:strand:+ start:3519 stop:4226 length:708 start_codon:yes stop_codon:yes gene_type:complete
MASTSGISRTPLQPASPFKGGPSTKFKRDKKGEPQLSVSASALTPFGTRIVNWASGCAGIAALSGGFYTMAMESNFTGDALGTVLAFAASSVPVTWLTLKQVLKSSATVVFTATHIEIRKFMGGRRFERAYPHAFVLLPHDKTATEKERHAFLDRKRPPQWWSLQRKKYYGKSYHVVLTHLGERYDVLTVYGQKKAVKIQARLQACDVVMNGVDFSDGGIALSPETDWATDAGGL